ncbi:MAG: sulfatase family protein [Candidatus Sumerlaeaceae bacterium]
MMIRVPDIIFGIILRAVVCLLASSALAVPPNVILILADDLGYNDIGCYGQKRIRTPNLDRMAQEGMRFTDFYVASSLCSPSRAALLTGCYAQRIGLGVCSREQNGKVVPWHVLYPRSLQGLNPGEITIAEILKTVGYATACVGKWHLGDHPQFLPTRQGFDSYFGIPYSNDMKPLVYLRGDEVIEPQVKQETVTERYTEEAIRFITEKKDAPFFLYLAHNAPHTPLFVSERFRGHSPGGLYGDVVESLDWSIGEIFAALKRLAIDERTLVIFMSDNGPWLVRGENGGSATPLRNGKGSTYEGGMRVPFIVRWPGTVPASSVCGELATAMDLLPTIARIAGTAAPTNRKLDGKDILALIKGDVGARSPHEQLLYYFMDELQAIRSGPWKMKLETTVANDSHYQPYGDRESTVPRCLYNLETDPGEQKTVLKDHPEVERRLRALVELARKDLGDSRLKELGENRRPCGFVDPANVVAAPVSTEKAAQ